MQAIGGIRRAFSWRGRGRRALALVCAAVALCAAQGAFAQTDAVAPQDDRRYAEDVLVRERALSSEIMSPFCPGRTLINCTSDQARGYREVFKRYLAEGVSERELKAQFEQQWGAAARSTPRSAVGWLLPSLILCAGAGLLVFALLRLRSGREVPVERAPIDRELERELERELKSRGL